MSPSEAARRLGTTARSIQRWIALGRLPARRVGGRWRVASDALDAFAASGQIVGAVVMPPDVAGGPGGIRRVFVANRGEIVRRIRRTAERLGMSVIEPPTEGVGAVDLLDVRAVVAAAAAAGADAVHPGFGFLAENAGFAEAVEAAGIALDRPATERDPRHGRQGRRAPSRGGARDPDRTGLRRPRPVERRTHGGGQRDRLSRSWSSRPPVAAARGCAPSASPRSCGPALDGARREARSSFDDDRLILERFVEGPRHVEVQVLFDGAGAGVHLGERDCSTQRRHQKVLEETPSPAVTPVIRRQLTDAALRLASAVGYRSAGTCEFLLTDRGEVYFLEMNTRLQVEHPVTEAVTGLDLVEQQLRIAEGRPLAVTQAHIEAALAGGGHAIEVRLYAEDAEDDFLPATGRVERLTWPSGPGVRVDAGIDEGSVVGSRFDPMLAKIIVHGADRAEALDRLKAALDATVVLGLTTNLRFLRWLVREPALREGQMRIDTLPRIWPPDDWATRAKVPDAAWQAAGRALAGAGWLGGWRLERRAADPPRNRRRGANGDPRRRGGPCRQRRRP